MALELASLPPWTLTFRRSAGLHPQDLHFLAVADANPVRLEAGPLQHVDGGLRRVRQDGVLGRERERERAMVGSH